MCASALHPACRSLSSCCRMLVHLKRWVLGLQTLMVGAARCCQRKGSNQVRDAFFSTACANKACAACDYYLFISLHPLPIPILQRHIPNPVRSADVLRLFWERRVLSILRNHLYCQGSVAAFPRPFAPVGPTSTKKNSSMAVFFFPFPNFFS